MNGKEKELANRILELCAAEELPFAKVDMAIKLAQIRLGEERKKAAEKAGLIEFGPGFTRI
ncbi:MAG: hypothetical protein ACI4PV_02885 [Butyricicoccus sp.]